MKRLTELQALNTMLSAIGSSPKNRIDDEDDVDSILAKQILDEVVREMQTHEWHWNTDSCVTFSPDSDKRIRLPDNVSRVETQSASYIQRGDFLYDRRERSYEFTEEVTLDVAYILSWEELPEAARNYAMVRATRRFMDSTMGAPEDHRYTLEDEQRAYELLKAHDIDILKASVFSTEQLLTTLDRGGPRRAWHA